MFPTRGAFRFFNVPAVLHAACSNRPSRVCPGAAPPVVFPWARAVPLLSFFRQSMPAPLPLFFPGSPRQLPCLRCPIVSAATALSSPRLRTRDRMLRRALTPPVARPLLPLPFPAGQKKRAVLCEPLPELFLCAPRPPGRPPRLNRRATPPQAPSCCGKRSSRRRPPRGAPPASRPTRGPRRRAPWYP